MMSANLNSSLLERPPQKHGGAVWHKLNSERANICEELLKDTAPVGEFLALYSMSKDVMPTPWKLAPRTASVAVTKSR